MTAIQPLCLVVSFFLTCGCFLSFRKKQQQHSNTHFAAAFFKELIQGSKDLLDDGAISEIIKTCNVIKNEKVQASKRKVKYQAQKSSKRDKTAEAKARKVQVDLYGDNDDYDEVDDYGADFEDAFF